MYIRNHFNYTATNDEIKAGIIDFFYTNLLKLTTAIEIYLRTCNAEANINGISNYLKIGLVDKVISFNYTNTFKLYMNNDSAENICHIHGKIRNKIEDFNSPLVLGIDEYLSKDIRDSNVDWVMFKKYFQRIYKYSDYKYKGWGGYLIAKQVLGLNYILLVTLLM